MLINTYSEKAISELEKQRTGNYGIDIDEYHPEKECEYCANKEGNLYKIGKHIICEDCICNSLRDIYASIDISPTPEGIDAGEILRQIIQDFSDNEIMCYVDEMYERI